MQDGGNQTGSKDIYVVLTAATLSFVFRLLQSVCKLYSANASTPKMVQSLFMASRHTDTSGLEAKRVEGQYGKEFYL